MNLTNACCDILSQLKELVNQINENDFKRSIQELSGATIGQHLRHTLEFFFCLEQGYNTGIINYDNRAHDKLIETDKYIALNAIARIEKFLHQSHEDVGLKLSVSYDLQSGEITQVETNYFRELVYNIEHAVHHMAIIKIAIRTAMPYVTVHEHFGVAASTIRFQASQVEVAQ